MYLALIKFFILWDILIYMMDDGNKENIESFANEFMAEEGLKGKAKRMKIMRIIESVGFDKRKVKTALLRSTIKSRITHE